MLRTCQIPYSGLFLRVFNFCIFLWFYTSIEIKIPDRFLIHSYLETRKRSKANSADPDQISHNVALGFANRIFHQK